MRATVIHGAGDVRVETVPDPVVREPTDAVVRVLCACICGTDLWPYRSMSASEPASRIGHEFIGVVEETGSDVSGLRRGEPSAAIAKGPLTVAPVTFRPLVPEFVTVTFSAQLLLAVRITIARSAAALTRGTGSLRRPVTAANASPMRWRAITLAAISRTRHALSVVAWMIAAVARLSQTCRRPRAAQTLGQ